MDIKKQYIFNCTIADLFEAITDQNRVEAWTGSEAEMQPISGSEFSMWNKAIIGFNESVSSKKIVQQWKDASWSQYSKVVMTLAEFDKKAQLNIVHSAVPEEAIKSVVSGWDDYFYQPLKNYLESLKSNQL